MWSTVSIPVTMVKVVILILSCVQLSLVQGLNSKNESPTNSTRRILFGTPTSPQNYPFMVRLTLGSTGYCGGSIIANNWVMTAAHCTYPAVCNDIQISLGMWSPSEFVNAAECFIHEQFAQFRTNTFEYDISLLRVNKDLLQDGRARAVTLPQPGLHFPSGTSATLIGWGQTEGAVYPNDLLHANAVLEGWDQCNVRAKSPFGDIPIRVVCTQGTSSPPSSNCFGDSGGPLMVNGVAIGVFSFLLKDENGFCLVSGLSMFTSVVEYLPWIYRHVDPSVDTSTYPVLPEHII